MKFVFDTSYRNNKYEIKISVGEGLAAASTVITIGYNDNYIQTNQQVENVLKIVLDNTRFTVKERIAAEEEMSRFIGYLHNEISAINPRKENVNLLQNTIVDIFEDEDKEQKIDDDELLNEQ